jgi:GntR family transcriptional regulator, rspAB operon transcriptional repressor
MESIEPVLQEREPKAAENIHRVLKNEILRGVIDPGTLLSESKLAKRFGVSRTPVREALSMLANDRLIFSLPQRGHQVRTISFSEAIDAFRIRELLEVEAIRLAVHRISNEQIQELRQMVADARNTDSMVWNYEFHTTIAKASGNRILAEFTEELFTLMERILTVHPDFHNFSNEAIRPEIELLNALEQRDEAAACDAMRRHIRDTMNQILKV